MVEMLNKFVKNMVDLLNKDVIKLILYKKSVIIFIYLCDLYELMEKGVKLPYELMSLK